VASPGETPHNKQLIIGDNPDCGICGSMMAGYYSLLATAVEFSLGFIIALMFSAGYARTIAAISAALQLTLILSRQSAFIMTET